MQSAALFMNYINNTKGRGAAGKAKQWNPKREHDETRDTSEPQENGLVLYTAPIARSSHAAREKKNPVTMSQKISLSRVVIFLFRTISLFSLSSAKGIHTTLYSVSTNKRYHKRDDLLSSSSASFVTRRDNNNNNISYFFVYSKIWKKTNTKNNNIDNNIKSNKKRFNRLGRTKRPV